MSTPALLAPGDTVSNLAGVLADDAVAPRPSGLGTLGFLALVNGSRRRDVVLVASRHVLLAHGAGRGDPVYRPAFASSGDPYVVRRETLEPVAEILDEGAETNHRFAYRGEPPGDYFVDCATARLLGEPRLAGAHDRAPVHGVARLHPLDVAGRRAPRVRVLGGLTGVTEGRAVEAAATVEAGGEPRFANIVIRWDDGSRGGPGDSGALVLDERDRAVGLVWGRSDRDPELTYACHIHPVLDRLDVTMLPR